MRYCVVKNTTSVIDGGLNSDETMYQNAINAGYDKSQVEILTQLQYDERKEQESSSNSVDYETILKAKIEVQIINTLIDIGVI